MMHSQSARNQRSRELGGSLVSLLAFLCASLLTHYPSNRTRRWRPQIEQHDQSPSCGSSPPRSRCSPAEIREPHAAQNPCVLPPISVTRASSFRALGTPLFILSDP